MQALFYMDIQNHASMQMLECFCENFRPPKKSRSFFLDLVTGFLANSSEIDTLISRFSKHWKIDRMSGVDRNVMRIAVYEMLYCKDIPPKVSINEAVDIGKKFGTEESGAFINGIMDSVRLALENEKTSHRIETKADTEVT